MVLGGEGNAHGTYKFRSSPSPWGGSEPSNADRVTLTVRVAIEDYVMFTFCVKFQAKRKEHMKKHHTAYIRKNIIQLESALNPTLFGTATSDGVRLRANGRNHSQHCCAKNVGRCCVRVGSGVQTDATTPNKSGTYSASWEEYNPYVFVIHA